MKKILSTLAIAGVATLALASCGGGNEPQEEAYAGKLTVWCSTSDGVSTLFKEKGDAWLKANGYDKVTLDVTPVGEGDAVGKVLEDLDAAADIYCFAQDQLSRAVQGNAIAKVANNYLEDVKTRNSEGGLISGRMGDVLYAYPLTNDNGYIMMYDKSVMEGVDMTDMSAVIAKCNATGTKFSFNLGNIWYSAAFFFGLDEKGERLCQSAWQTDATGKFTNMIDTFNSDNGLIALKGMNELV
ncbi:MAG: extracellular solute-binding protein, partial [Acholeplasmatales bacterium]|nr:extracellular solute-binding protein [Acholeplasmatales bacterium]